MTMASRTLHVDQDTQSAILVPNRQATLIEVAVRSSEQVKKMLARWIAGMLVNKYCNATSDSNSSYSSKERNT